MEESKSAEFLRSCPFCGSGLIFTYLKSANFSTWVTVCETCGARGGIADSKAEAAEMWNTRIKEDKRK